MLKAMSQFSYFLNFVRRLRRIFIEYLVEVEMIIFFFFEQFWDNFSSVNSR